MKKADYLNVASDLRRIANWMARGQKEKLSLMVKLWENAKSQKEALKIIKHFVGDIKPESAFKKDKPRLFFAEQVLISSFRLQNMAI